MPDSPAIRALRRADGRTLVPGFRQHPQRIAASVTATRAASPLLSMIGFAMAPARTLALTLAFVAAAGPALSQGIYTQPSDGFVGEVSASGPGGGAIYAGTTATVEGQDMTPGQTLTLMRGSTVLTPQPLTVAADGSFTTELAIPADAATGPQPLVVIAENPAAASVVELKVSPNIPVSGADRFDIESVPSTKGPYQVAYSAASDAIFVTGAVGRPPVKESELVKMNADTLEKLAAISPAPAPGDNRGVYAIYGVGVDDENGNVWVTNTRQGTVAVYKQDDLSLVRQFEPDPKGHSRDAVVAGGKVYISQSFTGAIHVYDAKTLEQLPSIEIASAMRGEEFGAMSLEVHDGKLFTSSLNTPEAAVVDLASGAVRVIPIKGAVSSSGVAYDAQDGLIFVASQGTDNVLIVDEASGEVRHDVEVGASVLSVAFDPVSRLAFTANRDSGTVTVIDTQGQIVANLEVGGRPNQVKADGRGNIYAVNRAFGDSPTGERVWRIRPKQ